MLGHLILAAALSGMPAAAQGDSAGPVLRIENGRVTEVAPMTPGSGIFAVYRDFDVVVPGGRSQRMYVLWAGPNQYMPEIGSVCTIVYRREPLAPQNLHRPDREGAPDDSRFNVVHELNCGFTPGMPPLVQRGSPSAL